MRVKLKPEDCNFITEQVGGTEGEGFHIKLSKFIQLYKDTCFQNLSAIIQQTDTSGNCIKMSNADRQLKRRELIENTPIFNTNNPLIKSLTKFTQLSKGVQERYISKLAILLNSSLMQITSNLISLKHLIKKDKLNDNVSVVNMRNSIGLTLDKQVKVALEHNFSTQLFDKLKEGLRLNTLYSTSYCDHYISNIKELARKEFKVSSEGGKVTCCPVKVVEYWKSIFGPSGLSFNTIKISMDYGQGKTRLAINPLFPDDKGKLGINQNSKFCIPVMSHDGKENLSMIPGEFLSQLPFIKILTIDLALWFKVSKNCPCCNLSFKEFQHYSKDRNTDMPSFQQRSGPFNAPYFIFCVLHMCQRLIVTFFQNVVHNGGTENRELRLQLWICCNVRKTFKYGTNKKVDDSLAVDSLSIWLNLNEALLLLKSEELCEILDLRENESRTRELLQELVTSILEWNLEDWKDAVKFNKFTGLTKEFDRMFVEMNGGHTYYSHALVDHLVDQILFLIPLGLTLFDLGNWNLENIHCVNNRFNQFQGSSTLIRSEEGNFLVPLDCVERELLNPLVLLLLKSPDFKNRSYADLRDNEELQQRKRKRIEITKTLFSKTIDPNYPSKKTMQKRRNKSLSKMLGSQSDSDM